MDIPHVLTLYDQQERIQGQFPDAVREDTGNVVRYFINPERFGFVLYQRLGTHPTDKMIDEVIQQQIEQSRGRCTGLEWKIFGHDAPLGLVERLRAHQFQEDEPGSIMVLDLANMPHVLRQPFSYDIRRKQPNDSLDDVVFILNNSFGGDHQKAVDIIARQLNETPERISIYIVYINNEPASCGWIRFPPHDFASLWAGSTLNRYRKQGLYTALVAVRAQEALQRGYRYLIIDAGDMSRPLVAKVGFEMLTTITGFVYTHPTT